MSGSPKKSQTLEKKNVEKENVGDLDRVQKYIFNHYFYNYQRFDRIPLLFAFEKLGHLL